MECKEERIDTRIPDIKHIEEEQRVSKLVLKLNQTMPMTEECNRILKDIFRDNIGENACIIPPMQIVCANKVKIGKNVFVNNNSLFMGRGGITIEDDVQIGPNVQLISNNHDFYDRQILSCKPVLVKKGAWIGAGVSIVPGICVGKYAIVGTASVVTHDVPDYAVVVGNPARVIRTLDKTKFEEQNLCMGTSKSTVCNVHF